MYTNISTKYLRPNHGDFDIKGKPALVICHLQRGLAGEGTFFSDWNPRVSQVIKNTGTVDNCRKLADVFRSIGLPVIFVVCIPSPIRSTPVYGDLFDDINCVFPREPFGKRPYYMDERTKSGLEIMPELGRTDTDYILFNWQLHAFCCSGLEHLCRTEGIDTLIWGGFSQNSIVYTSCLIADGLWLNNIIPVDASCVHVPPAVPGYHEQLPEYVAESLVRVMMPCVARCTDTETIIRKISESK